MRRPIFGIPASALGAMSRLPRLGQIVQRPMIILQTIYLFTDYRSWVMQSTNKSALRNWGL